MSHKNNKIKNLGRFVDLGFQGLKTNFLRINFPYKLTFAITYRCNARCQICNIWKSSSQNELSLQEIEKFVKNSNFKWLNLTGGEPFLREDFAEIIKAFVKYNNPYVINCTTNGILTPVILNTVETILKEVNLPKFILTVSIDGPEKIHNQLRGVDCWRKSVETFKKLQVISKKHDNFSCYIGFTLSPYNIGYLEETYKILNQECNFKKESFHINIMEVSEVYYQNKGLTIEDKHNFFQKARKEIQDFYKDRKKLINPVNILDDLYLKWLNKYLDTQKAPFHCQALNASIFINSIGDIYPCIVFNKKLANLREIDYNLNEFWNSKLFQNTRNSIKNGNCPQCWTPCEAYQSIVGNIFEAIFKHLF
ncbi:MAG: radical SAM protein [Candidatus Pacebacteria bacterium]|nr:radical SAM protein [Candidatus Paceibacterota bacterium]